MTTILPIGTTERFWSRADMSGGADACWTWTGRKRRDGYGVTVRVAGLIDRPHRVALALSLGRPLMVGMYALHSCDNTSCVNPSHLREGTQSDNMSDASIRGRLERGEDRHCAKLTEQDVLRMRMSTEPTVVLARRFGVSERNVRKVRDRETWRHVA